MIVELQNVRKLQQNSGKLLLVQGLLVGRGVCVLSHIFSALQLLPLNCKGSCGLGGYTHDKDAMVWFLRESLLKLVLQRTI